MPVEISIRDSDSQPYDGCNKYTVANLNINGVIIPLCKQCLEELEEEIKRFQDVTFCHICKNYVSNPCENKYSVYCNRESKYRGTVIKVPKLGYVRCERFNKSYKDLYDKKETE